MSITIPDAVSQMLAIVEQLCVAYPKKKFTLDGRLVGDIGEVLVEEAYDIKLYGDTKKHHDAECLDGRLVQIKATMHDEEEAYLPSGPCAELLHRNSNWHRWHLR